MKPSQKVLWGAACVLTNLITFMVVHLSQSSFKAELQHTCFSLPPSLHEPPTQTAKSQQESVSCKTNISTQTLSTSTPCPCEKKLPVHNITHQESPTREKKSNETLPTIFVISPTYSRLTQKSDLTSVCVTLMHVPNLVWIVVEDSDHRSELVKNLLERCEIQTVHLNAVTPDYYKKDSSRPRGVLQRNKGLSWMREHYSAKNCNGVVYFGDDDNKYDLRLFEQMRKTVRVSVWPVAFAAGLMYEGPECDRNGAVARWHVGWGAERKFPIDMAGFSVHLCLLMRHSTVEIGKDGRKGRTKPGYLETSFLEQLVEKDHVECRGLPNEIMVWHVKTQKPNISRDRSNPSKPDLEV